MLNENLNKVLLKNEKLSLRPVEPEDLELLYVWENDPALWSVGNTRQPFSKYALKQYILDAAKDIYETLQLRLMMVDNVSLETVGTVDLFDFDIHNSKIALGLFVDAQFQGKGFAKAALSLTEEYVFGFLKLNQLYCHIAATNTASRNMFEKEGYESNGVLKKWIKTIDGYDDIILFQRFNVLK